MTERIFDAVLCIILIGIAAYCVHGVRKTGNLKSRMMRWMITTNREKLRAMTDEELAKYVCDLDKMCSSCPGVRLCTYLGSHANGMIKWLQAEAEDDE